MAALKQVISKSGSRAVVKITNNISGAADDAATITLATDILGNGQSVQGTPTANITKIWYSAPSSSYVEIKRNSVIVATLYGHDTISEFGFSENNTSDIVVNLKAGGTVIIEIAKLSGYSAANS